MLGAPVKNNRWSWGATRADGTLFLLVWQDQTKRQDGATLARLTNEERFRGKLLAGNQERLKHIDLLKSGTQCYLIMGIAKDVSADSRKVNEIIEDAVFPCGKLVEIDGDLWVEMRPRIPVRDVMPKTD